MSHNPAYLPYMTNSLAIRQEIQRFESVHPSIYAIYDLIELVPDPLLAQQIREHVVCIEGKKESTKLGLSRLLAALGSFKFVLHIKISSFRHVWMILMVEGCFSVTTTENMAFFHCEGREGASAVWSYVGTVGVQKITRQGQIYHITIYVRIISWARLFFNRETSLAHFGSSVIMCEGPPSCEQEVAPHSTYTAEQHIRFYIFGRIHKSTCLADLACVFMMTKLQLPQKDVYCIVVHIH